LRTACCVREPWKYSATLAHLVPCAPIAVVISASSSAVHDSTGLSGLRAGLHRLRLVWYGVPAASISLMYRLRTVSSLHP